MDESERLSLEREFDKEEILAVLQEVEGDKAPGLDGFTMGFFPKVLECGRRRCYGFFLGIFIELASLKNPLMPLSYV